MSKRHNRPRKPRRVSKETYDDLRGFVSPGQVHQYQAPNIPDKVPGSSAYDSLALMGLDVGSSDIPWPSGTMPPVGTAYLSIGFRIPAASPLLRKMDTMWFYRSSDGQAWGLHSKEHPHHHDWLSASTGVFNFIPYWDVPIASGIAKEYFQGSSDSYLSQLRDGLATQAVSEGP